MKAGSAVLDPREGKRLPLFDPKTRARVVYLHPAFLRSAPRQLVVSAGLNTLALALEGLMSRRGDPLADATLMHAVRLLARQLPHAAKSDELDIRAELMAASILCGHGSDYTGAGMAIPIGHAISTSYPVDMGISDSIMMPHVVRFNAEAARAGLQKIATALDLQLVDGKTPAAAVVCGLGNIYAALALPRRLRDVGVTQASLGPLAAISFDDWFLQGNPRSIKDVAELQKVLKQAW